MPTDPLLVAKLAPVVLLIVVAATVLGVVAPIAVEFRPPENTVLPVVLAIVILVTPPVSS
jgi:hypothetical protein